MLSLNKLSKFGSLNVLLTNRLSRASIAGNKLKFSTISTVNKQFIVLALDHDDPDAGARRLSARSDHLSRIKKYKEAGSVIIGGAILSDTKSDDAAMIGSVIIMEADSEEDVKKIIDEDPYVINKVWAGYEISGFKIPPI